MPDTRPIAPVAAPSISDRAIAEGFAHVVAVEGGLAWFEPEQTTACGGCKAASACGVEPGNKRLVARRFSLPNDHDFTVGERVVVGVAEGIVTRASLAAFGLPLLGMLVAGVTTQKTGGGDGAAALAAVLGLVAGLGLARLWAARSFARGELRPHFIRRVYGPVPGGACHSSDG